MATTQARGDAVKHCVGILRLDRARQNGPGAALELLRPLCVRLRMSLLILQADEKLVNEEFVRASHMRHSSQYLYNPGMHLAGGAALFSTLVLPGGC
jgi:hypothetical protein